MEWFAVGEVIRRHWNQSFGRELRGWRLREEKKKSRREEEKLVKKADSLDMEWPCP